MPNHVPNLAEKLRSLADAAARRRQAEPGSPDHDAALREMVRIQGELTRDAPPPPWDADDEGGAVSTPAPWRTPER